LLTKRWRLIKLNAGNAGFAPGYVRKMLFILMILRIKIPKLVFLRICVEIVPIPSQTEDLIKIETGGELKWAEAKAKEVEKRKTEVKLFILKNI